jgi:hypothetical protein
MCGGEMPPSSPAAGRPRQASTPAWQMLDTTLSKPRLQLYPKPQGCAVLTHRLQQLSLAAIQGRAE